MSVNPYDQPDHGATNCDLHFARRAFDRGVAARRLFEQLMEQLPGSAEELSSVRARFVETMWDEISGVDAGFFRAGWGDADFTDMLQEHFPPESPVVGVW